MRACIWLSILLACSACALCVRPLARSQPIRAHRVEGPRRLHQRHHLCDRADAGWLSVAGHGIRIGPLRWCPSRPVAAAKRRATPQQFCPGSFGCARRHSLDWHGQGTCQLERRQVYAVSRMLPVTAFIHCCKMPEERSGLRLKTRAGSVPSESGKTQCYGAGSFGFSVSALYEDHEGNLWVSAANGSVAMGAWSFRALRVARGRSGRRTARRRQRCTPDDHQ